MMKKLSVLAVLLVAYACSTFKGLPATVSSTGWKTKTIPPSLQTEGGDPEKGFRYLIYGDYLGSGFPFDLVEKRMAKNPDSVLQREGSNANAPFFANVFEVENGETVLNGNCFSCHAGPFNGEMVIGLGNSFSDFRKNMAPMARLTNLAVKLKYGKRSKEWEAFENFGLYLKAMAPYIQTNQPGVNPAANLAEACVRFRDPVDLTYTGAPNFETLDYPIATDVPPLWNVRKKNALYYTAVGRGDFTKLLFQASVLGIPDSTAARQAVTNFKDVVAWLRSLEPPAYPGPVDRELASLGEALFTEHCSGCHGTYGREESYPNKVVSLEMIGTDPLYAGYAVQAPIVDWYNKSWFALSEPKSSFQPEAGYIAPPLDGIWATAPYLHNGSVPTLDDLLNSSRRPAYWNRSGRSEDYDYQKVGWKYTAVKNGRGKWTYDTTLPGYSNKGHYFGDKLNDQERRAVIEYLKTL